MKTNIEKLLLTIAVLSFLSLGAYLFLYPAYLGSSSDELYHNLGLKLGISAESVMICRWVLTSGILIVCSFFFLFLLLRKR